MAFLLSYTPNYSAVLPPVKGTDTHPIYSVAPRFSSMTERKAIATNECRTALMSRERMERAFDRLCGKRAPVPRLAKMLSRDKPEKQKSPVRLNFQRLKALCYHDLRIGNNKL